MLLISFEGSAVLVAICEEVDTLIVNHQAFEPFAGVFVTVFVLHHAFSMLFQLSLIFLNGCLKDFWLGFAIIIVLFDPIEVVIILIGHLTET